MRTATTVFALMILLAAATPAHADVVSLCSSDTQGGPAAPNFARAMAAAGTVTFACPPGSVITLSRGYVVTQATRVDGGGRVTLDGGDHVMFEVRNGAALRFSDMTIRHANGSRDPAGAFLPNVHGGVVRGNGSVELLRTTVSGSLDAFWLFSGSIRLRASRLEGNRGITVHAANIDIGQGTRVADNTGTPLESAGGTVSISDTEFVSNGTSTFTNCRLAIARSSFNAHVGTAEGGALRIDCNATIEKTTFNNNRAVHGGAIYLQIHAAQVTMRRVRFTGNVAQDTGGAIAVERSGRSPALTPITLTVRSSVFDTNRARLGGAVYLQRYIDDPRVLQGAGVTFIRNTASENGGAIYANNATLQIARGVFVSNEAATGGGAIYAVQEGRRTAEFANTIFADNRSAQGGSVFHGGAARFISSTIAANAGLAIVADASPPPVAGGALARFPIRFVSTIVSGPLPPCGAAVASAPYEDLGHSIQYPGTSCGTTMPAADPGLGPLLTPMPWSPALNAGDNAVCQAVPVSGHDVYGTRRPLSTNCSIGAVEGDLPRLVGTWLKDDDRGLATLFRNALGLRTRERRR